MRLRRIVCEIGLDELGFDCDFLISKSSLGGRSFESDGEGCLKVFEQSGEHIEIIK